MSAIQFAMKHFVDSRTHGRIEACGSLYQEPGDDREPTYFAIIKIREDRRLEAWYDFGKDIILPTDLQVGDNVMLVTRENNRVEWVPDPSFEAAKTNIITAQQVYAERGKSEEILQTEKLQRTFSRRRTTAGKEITNGSPC